MFLLQEVGSIIGKVCYFVVDHTCLYSLRKYIPNCVLIIVKNLNYSFTFFQKGETVKKMREEVGLSIKKHYLNDQITEINTTLFPSKSVKSKGFIFRNQK